MKILPHPQGSLAWLLARLWRLTASSMKANITTTGELSKSKAAYAEIDKMIAGMELAKELSANYQNIKDMDDWELKRFMAHYNGETFSGSIHTERGHEYEPDAIAGIAKHIGQDIKDVGMCVMGDSENGAVSCSPDGLIYDSSGELVAGAEVKCPCLFNYYSMVCENKLPDAYKMQVHASMAICEVDSWHFGAYFKGYPMFHLEVKRDAFTDKLRRSLEGFSDLYAERYAEVTASIESLKVRGEAA